MHARPSWLPFLSVLLALASSLCAQDGTLTLTAAIEPATAKPGDAVTLVLKATVTAGWHAYGALEQTNIPVALAADKLQLGGLERAGEPQIPPGNMELKGDLRQFPLPNVFTVKQPLKVPTGMAGGTVEVAGAFDFQLCDESMCLPPDEAKFSARLVVDAPVAPKAAPAGGAQDPKAAPSFRSDDGKIEVLPRFEPATARAGETATLVLKVAVLDPEYHAYGALETEQIPVGLSKTSDWGSLAPEGAPQIPPGEKKERAGRVNHPLPQGFEVKQIVRVPADAKPGELGVDAGFTYQICNETGCLEPAEVGFEAKLVVEAGAARPERSGAAAAPTKTGTAAGGDLPKAAPADDDNPFGSSWWALILACIGGGLFALAMPCTYPMIPITFSFFTKQAEKRGGKVLPLALVYGFGIVLMFTLVGALLSTVIIDVVNHWLTNAVIGAMFVFFAFVLFGWINLEPPQALQQAAGKATATGGYLGVFFMGATLVITSFTCTAPIVGSLLANVAQFGTGRVAIGMAIFGATMALPFVLLSLAPTKVKAMPRSGEWMETLKVSLGFVELAAALKFVSMVDFAFGWQALPRELFLLLWTAIFGLWALFLFGVLRKAGSGPNEGVAGGRMAAGMFVTLLATYFLFGALGNKLDAVMTGFIPGYSNSLVSKADGKGGKKRLGDHVIVYDDMARAIEVAKADDKLLLYNFTGFN
jgi:thiol:disulfide interchange protein DsbD